MSVCVCVRENVCKYVEYVCDELRNASRRVHLPHDLLVDRTWSLDGR